MSELRQWMADNIGGLRDDRDTESYALEFLRHDHEIVLRDALLIPGYTGAIDRLNAQLRQKNDRIAYLEEYASAAHDHSVSQATELRRLRDELHAGE